MIENQNQLHVLQLYPRDMNIYGDRGNTLALKTRIHQYGFEAVIHDHNQNEPLPEQIDIVIGGGGQDSGQDKILADLHSIKNELHRLANNNTPMLMICGMYQLFGHYFDTAEGKRLTGIGILDVVTKGGKERLIGNVVAQSDEFGEILGYENHSGQTYLGTKAQPLARVKLGEGNNLSDDFEGARFNNVIGSYLHGALLPKNPALSDFLIGEAVKNRFDLNLAEREINIDDSLINLARQQTRKRPR